MASPKPVVLSAGSTPTSGPDPVPFSLTNAGDHVANITADPGALADLAAARTALTASNNKINAILAELRQAGVLKSS